MSYLGPPPARTPVTSAQITDASVTAAKLATNAVTTVKIADDGVTTDKIGGLTTLATNILTETTAASGVTIDGALVKDGAITFGSGSSALGYYQEGTFTPIPLAGSTDISGGGASSGNYTRIGNLVHVHMTIRVNRGTNTGTLTITALPFTVISSNNSVASSLFFDNGDAYNGGLMPGFIFGGNQSLMNAYAQPKSGSWSLGSLTAQAAFNASAQSYLILAGAYTVA